MKTLTDANFAAEISNSALPVLVDFYADWCGPCKMMAPHVEAIDSEMSDKVVVGKVDVDSNPQISAKFGIQSIPTIIIFKGGVEANRMVGYKDKDSLVKALS